MLKNWQSCWYQTWSSQWRQHRRCSWPWLNRGDEPWIWPSFRSAAAVPFSARMKWSLILILIMAHVPLLMGKRNRHNRDAAKKPEKEQNCVADFCLPHNYNSLELPSSDKQTVAINLEVNLLKNHGYHFRQCKSVKSNVSTFCVVKNKCSFLGFLTP